MEDPKARILEILKNSPKTKDLKLTLKSPVVADLAGLITEAESAYGWAIADKSTEEARRLWRSEEYSDEFKEGFDSAMANDIPIIIDEVDSELKEIRAKE